MKDLKSKCRIATVVIVALCISLAGFYGLMKPILNGCAMTYMYPTYIPISTPKNASSTKYGLYLYHEGWQQIDFKDHLKKLNGVPVLFIPGNGGSYKQVRSLGAESDRAYQGGPIRQNLASISVGGGMNIDLVGVSLPIKYRSRLDWFAVDLEGEHSAMDGGILHEHTEYVVHAIHRILDQYKESRDARSKEGASVSGIIPKSVMLVGHSMGGFVARAATVHPNLRKFAVETILTLSSPHQYPPLPLQPSLGHYYSHVNEEWRKGYDIQTSRVGYSSNPSLSHVIVVSISGGYNDYQVRSNLESLDGVVPPTHGFMISSTSMKNVWLSMEHQVILWCNQLVVQVSHTLLSLIDPKTSQPLRDVRQRRGILTQMLHSGIPRRIMSLKQLPQSQTSDNFPDEPHKVAGRRVPTTSGCPSNLRWNEDGLEGDLHIQTKSVTILSVDGRRRWLDIQKQVQQGDSYFVFVTNLSPCSGVRLHLWKKKGILASELSAGGGALEVTSKMVHIPSGSAPRQTEPGSQTEQPPPSAVFWLCPEDMDGFRFLTISVAPSPTVSGGPPPAATMGVGQFFNPKDGEQLITPYQLFHSLYSQKDMNLREDHPLVLNLTFSASLGLLPVHFSVRTTGCGIKRSVVEEPGFEEASKLCKLRCFPPVALSWDATSGLHMFPNFYTASVVVDSSPALWTSSHGSGRTSVILLVDPHCSYKTTLRVSVMAAAARFLLSYFPQISGLSVAVVFFALMQQASAWELDQPLPSMLSAVESNLKMPQPFFFLAILPNLFAILASSLSSQSIQPSISFLVVSVLCYVLANGAIVVLIAITQLLFYATGIANALMKKRWQVSDGYSNFTSTKVVRIVRANPLLITSLVAIALVWLVHPALGLFVLLLSHALCCHSTLSSFLMTSFGSHANNKKFHPLDGEGSIQHKVEYIGKSFRRNGAYASSSECTRSYGDTQLEIFHHRHGLLVLHLLAALMFVPSLVARLQRILRIGGSFPWFWDSVLCTCVILHGICDSKPEFNFFLFPIRLSFGYLVAGYFSYICAFALAPYRTFYAMAAIGVCCFTFRIIQRRKRKNGEICSKSRKHSHRH